MDIERIREEMAELFPFCTDAAGGLNIFGRLTADFLRCRDQVYDLIFELNLRDAIIAQTQYERGMARERVSVLAKQLKEETLKLREENAKLREEISKLRDPRGLLELEEALRREATDGAFPVRFYNLKSRP